MIDYPPLDSTLLFQEYIASCRTIIQKRREDLHGSAAEQAHIIDANCPYELVPQNHTNDPSIRSKYGVLLIHGLLDCPFTLREFANDLHVQGVFCRSVLLPGHGTRASDLLHVSHQDWIATVQYGIQSLQKLVENIFLIGYSTGAVLAIHAALTTKNIAGVILLAPAIKIKFPVDELANCRYVQQWFNKKNPWVYQKPDRDYAKYSSMPFHPIHEVSLLTQLIAKPNSMLSLSCPMLMAISRDDETISSLTAVKFFLNTPHSKNKLIYYSIKSHHFADTRIEVRSSNYPKLNIKRFSHIALPFSANNPHYGQHGDYVFASKTTNVDTQYGAYNHLQLSLNKGLFCCGLRRSESATLTYNPDFNYLAKKMGEFIFDSDDDTNAKISCKPLR